METQDLKNNRNEIIEMIETNYPSSNVKEFMTSMVRMLPMCESTDVLDYVTEVGDLMFEEKIDLSVFHKIEEQNRQTSLNCLPSSMR